MGSMINALRQRFKLFNRRTGPKDRRQKNANASRGTFTASEPDYRKLKGKPPKIVAVEGREAEKKLKLRDRRVGLEPFGDVKPHPPGRRAYDKKQA